MTKGKEERERTQLLTAPSLTSEVKAFAAAQWQVYSGVMLHTVSNTAPFTLIAGPCQMETRDHAMMMATELKKLSEELNVPLIFKASYDKANRTSIKGQRGIGLEDALPVFREIRETLQLPCITDVHEAAHCETVASAVDVLQIPAFLCRQTDLLIAAAKTGKAINVKKGQFLAPWDMKNVIQKVRDSGNDQVWACERGASFGYNTLVTDMRALPIMKEQCDCPVIFDATHSVQQPGGMGTSSGGDRKMAPLLARCALSLGIAGLFMETHQDPDNAPSDGPNMIPLAQMKDTISKLKQFDEIAKS